MKHTRKELFILCFLLAVLFLSVPAYAEGQPKKSGLRRFWERVTSHGSVLEKAPEAGIKPKPKPVPPKVKLAPPPKPKLAPLKSKPVLPLKLKPVLPPKPKLVPPEVGTKPEVKPGKRPAAKGPQLSKEEMVKTIKTRLGMYPHVISLVPGLSLKVTESGKKEYFYSSQAGTAVPVSDLDEETLHGVFVKISNEVTRIKTDRLMRQMRQQDQIRRQMHQQQQLRKYKK
ncbi:MAG: hypothetical protein DRP85_00310 [Candidatus Makaraimicrobium thalassicum]|nr:MAG: hypothetical protein DRP85_00310 [Candidatus Omnitrophota bacterium]